MGTALRLTGNSACDYHFVPLHQLPQRMAGMNLGGAAMMAAQPQAMVGQIHSMGMQVPGMSMNIAPTVPNMGSAGMGIRAFPQSAGAGHTFATNLWQ